MPSIKYVASACSIGKNSCLAPLNKTAHGSHIYDHEFLRQRCVYIKPGWNWSPITHQLKQVKIFLLYTLNWTDLIEIKSATLRKALFHNFKSSLL
jgi:hypothetical protein